MISPGQALKRIGLSPAKRLGQHFLIHRATAEKIAAAISPGPGDVVVEIGAGLGALSVVLARSGARVLALEIDPRLAVFLRRQLLEEGAADLVSILCMDVLHLDLEAVSRAYLQKLKIIGNLPYNISSPLLFRLLERADCLDKAVLMLQDEVAERLLAEPGSKEHGILSVLAAYHTERSRLMRLKPSQFYPQPRVDSAVVSLSFRPWPGTPRLETKWLLEVVKAAFSHRRKTLRNSLLASRIMDPESLDRALAQAAVEPKRRAESLTIEEFLRLGGTLEAQGAARKKRKSS